MTNDKASAPAALTSERPKGTVPCEPLKKAGHEDDVTRVSCPTCGARSPCASWPMGEPCLSDAKSPNNEWFHDARVVAASKKSASLAKWLAVAVVLAPPLTSMAPVRVVGVVAGRPEVLHTADARSGTGSGPLPSSVSVRTAAPSPAPAPGPKQDPAALPKVPAAVLRQGEPRKVKLRDIRYDESDNVRGIPVMGLARKGPAPESADQIDLFHEVGVLVESIPEVGLLEPPLCALEADGSLTLVAGYCRCAALIVLYGYDEVELIVFAAKLDGGERLAANLAENAGRKDVVIWRCIDRCATLADRYKWPTAQIAKKVGYSDAHVRNLVRFRRQIDPRIWAAWIKYGCMQALEKMLALLPFDHAEQLLRWNRLMGIPEPTQRGPEREREREREEEGREPEKPSPRRQLAPLTVPETRQLLMRVRNGVPGLHRPDHKTFFAGAEHALLAVLGEGAWTDPAKMLARPPAQVVPKKAATPAPKKSPAKKVAKKPAPKKPAGKKGKR